jgi:predicted RNA-binding protein Jag
MQVMQLLHTVSPAAHFEEEIRDRPDSFQVALREAQEAVNRVKDEGGTVELSPQTAYIRRLQHLLAERNHLNSRSSGKDPQRRVRIYRG